MSKSLPPLGSINPRSFRWIYMNGDSWRKAINQSHASSLRDKFKYEPESMLRQAQEDAELACCFELIASFEGLLRIDFMLRSDPGVIADPVLTTKFQSLKATKIGYISVTELVELWQDCARNSIGQATLVGLLGQYGARLRFRNWIAHGRSWEAQIRTKIDVVGTYNLVNRLLTSIQNFRPDFALAVKHLWPQ